MIKNYNSIVEVSHGATAEEIRKAYHRLVFIFHPDRNKGNKDSAEHFKLIQLAYEILSDPVKRSDFDRRHTKNAGSELETY